jgi:hypothetical protein
VTNYGTILKIALDRWSVTKPDINNDGMADEHARERRGDSLDDMRL